MTIPVQLHPEAHLASIGGEPHVFHCHHYNCFLQKSIADQGALIDAKPLLTDAAAEVVFSELSALGTVDTDELFRHLGFGVIDSTKLAASGGSATVKGSHYALGWISKFGAASEPVCFFNAGFIEAVARHRFKSNFTVKETACVASGARECTFVVTPGGRPSLPASPGMGTRTPFPPRPAFATRTPVDEAAIVTACGGLPLGGTVEGKIDAFGVSLTRHYANYYNLLSYRFDQQMESIAGPAAATAARLLLVEAGQVCAFHTFGGIMESAEWEGLIKPMIKTQEDWVYGMVSVVNALGWGRWSVAALTPGERLELVVDGSYESNGYLAAFGASTTPRCYLDTGATSGLMNLIYHADIMSRPALTPALYEQTFRDGRFFVAREVECRTMGAKACRFVAERL
ncbi:MAG: 4-vinyl reductase [Archangium sp.]|nr:4-vinyl reductase [Archangium sp.]MDP3154480.1 4-vinyl reductase [Archangium sp.]MDP3572915.1 4-vinyl reductase [Archangium sp.]